MNDGTRVRAYEDAVSDYAARLEEAEAKVREAERERDAWRERHSTARKLLGFEQERLNNQPRLESMGRFAGLALREAARLIIEDAGGEPVTLADIKRTLVANGYAFDTKFPGRALHAALIGATDVEKVAPSTYRWRGPLEPSPIQPDEVAVGDN